MHISTRFTRTAAVAALAGGSLLAVAGPAFASNTPPSDVNGTATVPASLTLTLSASSFSVNTPGGVTTVTTGGGITATVATNDASGYSIQEDLQTAMAGGSAFTAVVSGDNHFIPGADIAPYTYTGVGQLGGPASGGFPAPGNFVTLYAPSSASSGQGDVYPLSWAFAPPANQFPDTYSGTMSLFVAGN